MCRTWNGASCSDECHAKLQGTNWRWFQQNIQLMLSASQTVWKRRCFLPRICVTVQQTDENEPFYGLLIESRCTGFIKIFMVGGTECLKGPVMGWISSLFSASSHPAPGRNDWKEKPEPSLVGSVSLASPLVCTNPFYLRPRRLQHTLEERASPGRIAFMEPSGGLLGGESRNGFSPSLFVGRRLDFFWLWGFVDLFLGAIMPCTGELKLINRIEQTELLCFALSPLQGRLSLRNN